MPISSDTPTIHTRLEPDEYERLRVLAKENGRTIASEARMALRQWLRDREGKKT